MKPIVLVVWPRMLSLLYTFNHVQQITGKKAGFIPLPAATGAAYIPDDYDVRIIDENVSGEDWLQSAFSGVALVVLSFMNVQHERALAITERLKDKGVPVAWAGSWVSRDPDAFVSPADYLLIGPAEGMAERFFNDFAKGEAVRVYTAPEDCRFTGGYRRPRFDLLDMPSYNNGMVQSSEGCVFRCSFCSECHQPKLRPIPDVLADLEELRHWGTYSVTFADANLWVNRKRFVELMTALVEWNRQHNWALRFSGEVSLNLADEPELVQLLVDAGFMVVYPGIETLSEEGLRAISKQQNISRTGLSLLEMVRVFQNHGLEVMAGFIAGFDHDTPACFKEITDFVEQAGIVFTTAGGLIAMPNTPFYDQMAREDRLVLEEEGGLDAVGHASANFGGLPNFQPRNMTRVQLARYSRWMWEWLATVESFELRLESFVQNIKFGHRVVGRRFITDSASIRVFFRCWKAYLKDPKLRRVVPKAIALVCRYPHKIALVTREMCMFWQMRKSAEAAGADLDNVPQRPFVESEPQLAL